MKIFVNHLSPYLPKPFIHGKRPSDLRCLVTLMLWCFVLLANAQNQKKIDSLETILQGDPGPGEQRTILYELASSWLNYDTARAMDFIRRGNALALTSDNPENDLKILHLMGRIFFLTSQFDSANNKFSELITLAEARAHRKWQGQGLSSRAKVLRAIGATDSSNEDNLKAAEIFQEIDEKLLLADVYNDLSISYRNQGHQEKAMVVTLKALETYEMLNDHFGISQITGNLGLQCIDEGDYARALAYFIQSNQAAEQIGFKPSIGTNYVNMGTIFDLQKDFQEASEVYIKALNIFREIAYKDAEGITLNYLSAALTRNGQYDLARNHAQEAISIFEANGNKGYLASSLSNLGYNELQLKQFDRALRYLQRSLSLLTEIGDVLQRPSVLNMIGQAYYLDNQPDQAREYLLESKLVATANRLPKDLRDASYYLSLIENSTGNYQKAFEEMRAYEALKDSLINEEEIKKITRLKADFDFQKEKDSLAFQQKQAEFLLTQEIEQKQSELQAVMAGGILVLIILVLLYRSYLIKQRNNKDLRHKNEIIELKNNELTHKNQEITELRDKEKDMAAEALDMKQRELTTVTMLSYEKNTLLQQLGDHIGSLSKKVDDRIIPDLEEIKKIIKANLNEESWSVFTMQFEKVHPKFFSKLKSNFPLLTQYDLRLCSYLKVGMDNKEIAQVSAISPESVKKSMNRLKKKLGLGADKDLRAFLINY